jgi:hypothetical protein
MPELTTGAALRQLQQAQAAMKKARQAIRMVRGSSAANPDASHRVLQVGWASLANAHRILAGIPLEAANDDVLTKQLAVQRYATALLVRLRRIVRNEPGALDAGDEDELDDEI